MARLLIIGSETTGGRSLAKVLRRDGHRARLARTDAAAGRSILDDPPDMLVLAVGDPATSMRTLARVSGSGIRRMPAVAVLTADAPPLDADFPGFVDPLRTPFTDESLLARVDALLRVKEVLYASSAAGRTGDPEPLFGWAGFDRMARWLGYAPSPVRRRADRPVEPYLETAASIAATVEQRDIFDPGHAGRVAALCASMAARLGMNAADTETLLQAAPIHDIGKIGLSIDLLRRPSLTEHDRSRMRTHPRRGAALIRALTPWGDAAEIVLHHHERPDAGGYYGLPPEAVSLPARILAVAEVYDGMTTSHTSRPSLTPSLAIEALTEGSGTAYDTECVEALTATSAQRRRAIPVSKGHPVFEDH